MSPSKTVLELLNVNSRGNLTNNLCQLSCLFFFRVLGLLICPKIAEAKIMIKQSAFLYTPQRKKQTNKETNKKTSVGKKWFCTWEETI